MAVKTTTIKDQIYNGLIVAGLIAIGGMLWGLTIDVKMLQNDGVRRENLAEKTWEVANKNNAILMKKADDSTNSMQHGIIMEKMNDLKVDVENIGKRGGGYGYSAKPCNDIVKSN